MKRGKLKGKPLLTFTGLSVLVKLVTMVTGAEGAVGGVLTVMRATSVVLLTAVDNLHLNASRREKQNH